MKIKNQLSFLDASIKYKISPSDPLKILFESIDFSFIYTTLKDRYSSKGRHGYDPVSLFKAILLIYLGFANSERDLARKLKFDARLIYLCGFLFSETPTHATFHYFRKRLGEEIFSEILFTLIAQASAVIKDKNLVLSIDATHIEGFPKDPDARKGAKSITFYFWGYKIHMLCIAQDPPVPISIEVTPANRNDGKMLKPLVKKGMKSIKGKKVKLTGDAAYDTTENYSFLFEENILPYIAENVRGKYKIKKQVFIQDGKVFCPGGKELIYWGKEKRRKRIKFRCPLFKRKEPCLFKEICWKGKYGRSFYIYEGKEIREKANVIRCSPDFKQTFKRRTAIERLFKVLKNSHKLSHIRFRKIENIKIHAYLSIIAYLVRLITGDGMKLVEV